MRNLHPQHIPPIHKAPIHREFLFPHPHPHLHPHPHPPTQTSKHTRTEEYTRKSAQSYTETHTHTNQKEAALVLWPGDKPIYSQRVWVLCWTKEDSLSSRISAFQLVVPLVRPTVPMAGATGWRTIRLRPAYEPNMSTALHSDSHAGTC